MNDNSGKTPAEPLATTLYVVATPIGHLADLGARARDTLLQVRWIAAEDTRVAKVLLQAIGSSAQVFALHQHNEQQASGRVVELLSQGQSVALISDAGTPAISDPGSELVRAVRQAGYAVQPVPGPSAVTTLLSAAGLRASGFVFEGFLSAKPKARRDRLVSLLAHAQASHHAVVLFEAPHRIADLLADLDDVLAPGQQVVVGRELTKRFEQIVSLQAPELAAWAGADANHERGELVVAIEPVAQAASAPQAFDVQASYPVQAATLLRVLAKEMPAAQAAKTAAALLNVDRADAYRWLMEQRAEREAPDADQS